MREHLAHSGPFATLLSMRFLLALVVGVVCLHTSSSQANSGEPPPTPWLGVGFDAGRPLVVVTEVVSDGPADIAGIKVMDRIIAVGEHKVFLPNDLVTRIGEHKIGERVRIRVVRRGKLIELWATLTGFLDPQELIQRRLVDKKAPSFSLPVLQGKATGDLAKLKGKVVILEFWTSNCQVCKANFETLSNFQAEFDRDVVVLAITSEAPSQARQVLGAIPPGLTVLHDRRGQANRLYRCDNRFPTAVVIGRDGLVRHADTGVSMNMEDVLLAAKRTIHERASI